MIESIGYPSHNSFNVKYYMNKWCYLGNTYIWIFLDIRVFTKTISISYFLLQLLSTDLSTSIVSYNINPFDVVVENPSSTEIYIGRYFYRLQMVCSHEIPRSRVWREYVEWRGFLYSRVYSVKFYYILVWNLTFSGYIFSKFLAT